MKKLLLICFSLSLLNLIEAQKFWTQNGNISFHSDAALEKIEASNKQVSSVLDMATGDIAFSLLMKAFIFEKALMQEHFNEKYVESAKYPKASFKGSIVDFDQLDRKSTAAQKVMVSGTLTMHGVSQDVKSEGTISFDGSKSINANSSFDIKLSDYKIAIPSLVKDNISETIEIKVDINMTPYEK